MPYRPRWSAQLSIPSPAEGGKSITISLPVTSAHLVLNDHTRANELHIETHPHHAGIDPRLIESGIVSFYLGEANDFGVWEPSRENMRFIGRVVQPSRRGGNEQPTVLSIDALDYTSFFLVAKPFAASGTPLYSDTLADAWRRVCAATPGTADLAENIEFRGLAAPGPTLGSVVSERFRRLGRFPATPDVDAWAVWQQAVGSVGLLSFFELDTVVVTDALDYLTAGSPPRFVRGRNVLDFEETRNNDFANVGIGVTSFDPLLGRALEAVYPPAGDERIHGRTMAAARGRHGPSASSLESNEKRHYFPVTGITDPIALQRLAEMIWRVRSAQEMSGTLTTHEMRIETDDALDFDVLQLRPGDLIHVLLDDALLKIHEMQRLSSEARRVAYLQDVLGYASGLAQLVARNLERLSVLRAEFYTKSVEIAVESDEGGGKFEVKVGYCNKIQDGEALQV